MIRLACLGNMIKDLWTKYKSLIMYAVFGGLTTVVNMVSYYLSFNVLKIPNVPSTVIAWVLAVAFAFITNKLWVFDSPSFDAQTLKHEIPTFFGARLATGVLDVAIMYLAVDLQKGQAHLDAGEFLDLEPHPLAELRELAIRGEIPDAKTVIAVLQAWQILYGE